MSMAPPGHRKKLSGYFQQSVVEILTQIWRLRGVTEIHEFGFDAAGCVGLEVLAFGTVIPLGSKRRHNRGSWRIGNAAGG